MKYRLLAALVILTALVLGSCAPKHRLHLMEAGPGLEDQTDPALVCGALPNGFQYILMQNNTPKERVSMHLNVFAGSAHEADDEQGLAHYLEHMLFNGSTHFKPGELVEYFQSIGMDFGADANASTSYFKTVYDLNLPKGDRTNLEKGLLVLQDYAQGALLLEEEVERERGIILAEKRERDSVSYQKFKKEFEFELPDAVFNRRHPIGIESVIQKADRAGLKKFYDSWYRPDNMVLVAVGDFRVKELESLIASRFSKLSPRGSNPGFSSDRVHVSWHPHEGTKTFYYHEPEAGHTEITIERITWADFKVQTVADFKEELVKSMADQIFQNRLSWLIRKQKAKFSKASVYSGQFLHHVSIAAVNTSCEPEHWKSSLVQMKKLLNQALENGFDQNEWDRVKAEVVSSLEAAVKQADTRKTQALSRAILRAVNNKTLFMSPAQELTLLKPFIENLTLDQVNLAFKQSWKNDHRLILVTGNLMMGSEGGPSPEMIIKTIYDQEIQIPVALFQPFEEKKFPYLPIPGINNQAQTGIGLKTKSIEALDIVTVDFPNQVRLNLKQTDFQDNRILFRLNFGHGKRSLPHSKPGLSWISQTTVQQSGFGAMDADQLDQALAGRDVGIEFAIDDDYFSLTGSADPEEAELVFQLIVTYLQDPGIRRQGLDLAKTLYRQMYENLKKTPEGVMRIQGSRFLAGNDPRFGLDNPDLVDQITIQDVREWLMPYFRQSPLELSIVGDLDPETMIDLARVYLGSLEQRIDPPIEPTDLVRFPRGQSIVYNLDTRIEKGVVRMAFPTDDFWDIRQTRRLSMLARVFSERLRKMVREDLGASYSPYVYNHPSIIHDGYGVMHVVAPVDPNNSDRVLSKIHEIAVQLMENGVEENELDLVKKPVMSHIKDLRQTNSYWLNSVMADSYRHPERLGWATQILEDYQAVHHDELGQLAREYLNPARAAQIFIRP